MPSFIVHGDARLLEAAETIETRDDLSRHMFVTLEPGPDKTLWICGVPAGALATFAGLLYQLDRDEERDALVLRQVRMEFWPWEEQAASPATQRSRRPTLDEILETAFAEFFASLSGPGAAWFAKERDCVNRFTMAHLVPACTPGGVLHDPAQIGIEMAVKQPDGIGTQPSAPKDLVIWDKPHMTCWSPGMLPERAPLAILEWKSQRPSGVRQKTEDDEKWLKAFCEQNPSSLGYSVLLNWSEGGVLQKIEVTRFSGGDTQRRWFAMG